MKTVYTVGILAIALVMMSISVSAQQPSQCADQGTGTNLGWQAITFQYGTPPAPGYIQAPLLLTDGRVMVQFTGAPNGMPNGGNPYQDWYALTPDSTGSYANGTWSALASLTAVWGGQNGPYGPYAFASAVLPDGKVVVQGGEYNYPAGMDGLDPSNLGAIYNPTVGTEGSWSQLSPPGGLASGWPVIGDSQSVVLATGTYMVAACGSDGDNSDGTDCSALQNRQQATLNELTEGWVIIGSTTSTKNDKNDEEGYTLLPSGNVLTIDTTAGTPIYELFSPPPTASWTHYSMNFKLWGSFPTTNEIGPATLLPDGTVFAEGAMCCAIPDLGPAPTGIYNPPPNQSCQSDGPLCWTQGPSFPVLPGICTSNGNGGDDCPTGAGDEQAVLLPDGNVFLAAHDSLTGYYFYEYQPIYQLSGGGTFCSISTSGMPSSLTTNHPSLIKMLLLPNGQVMITANGAIYPDGAGTDYYFIYQPNYNALGINSAWAPTVTSINGGGQLYQGGTNYQIKGTQFNGLSQANMFGDDFQNATNYPLVQITDADRNVSYARTHNHSTMGVATGTNNTVWTYFDIPCSVASGNGTLVVIANGIPSASQPVNIASGCGNKPKSSNKADVRALKP